MRLSVSAAFSQKPQAVHLVGVMVLLVGFQTLKSILIFIKSIHAHGLNNPAVLRVLHFIIIKTPHSILPTLALIFHSPMATPFKSFVK